MGNQIDTLITIFTEFYYWVTVAIMFLIPIGFCICESAASRRGGHVQALKKNIMLLALLAIGFFLVGWWLYWALPNGPGLTGGILWQQAAPYAPWSEEMGANLSNRINGVLWAAFLLFSATAALIVSTALVERIRLGAFWFHGVLVGVLFWVVGASWGWHYDGWMAKLLGYHDAYAAGPIHTLAGGYALGMLAAIGPRLGKRGADGTARDITPPNIPLASIGMLCIVAGLWGLHGAANVPAISPQGIGGDITGLTWTATNIYFAPTSLSAVSFNFLLALSGGLMGGYMASRGNLLWTCCGGLAGIVAASAGNDLYHPLQAFLIGIGAAWVSRMLHRRIERLFGIDDALGVVATHGYAGFFGLVAAGFLLWGAPTSPYAGYATISPWGQTVGAVFMFFILGFLPAWLLSTFMEWQRFLRLPAEVEWKRLESREREP